MIRTALARLSLLAGLCLGLPAQASSPAATVTGFHEQLLDSMNRAAKLGCAGRIGQLGPAVDQAFDLGFIAERSLRRHWKTLDDAQRAAFTVALRDSVLTTYATEFASPGAVSFSTGETETLGNGDALVHATLSPKNGAPVSLDYQLRPRDGGWRVVNVLAEGVSDLALRASQYDALIKKDGLPALMARLDSQTRQLRGRCS